METRYGALHILAPVLSRSVEVFHTNGDDQHLQKLWAREQGLRTDDLERILLSQIEHHRTEVFYNLDPMRFASDFVRRLPGCVKTSVCWRAAPSGSVDLTGYDLVVCNFPSILNDWKAKGCKVAHLSPGHDPEMDIYANARRNDLDLLFVGGFSRHHANRSLALQAAASTSGIRSRFHLEDSRLTRIANFAPFVPQLGDYRHPPEIRKVRAGPVYGRDLYRALAGARIVLNGALDMAGEDRGNMRCFEATGCGAILLTDAGNYPDGFIDGETMITYSSPTQIPALIKRLIEDAAWSDSIAKAGYAMVAKNYSKDRQWAEFLRLV